LCIKVVIYIIVVIYLLFCELKSALIFKVFYFILNKDDGKKHYQAHQRHVTFTTSASNAKNQLAIEITLVTQKY